MPSGRSELLPLRPALRATAVALLAGSGACAVAAAALGQAGAEWAAWATATYVSWGAALTLLARRRLARAAVAAERRALPADTDAERLGPGRPATIFLLLLAAVAAAAAVTGATHVTAGVLAAAASTALAAASWSERLERRLGGDLYFDRATKRLLTGA